jgi:hypothetical protein
MIRKRVLEFIPALFLLLWGFWVWNPWWEAFPSSTIYDMMARLAPEWMWGFVYMLVGAVQLILLFTTNPKKMKFRQWTSFTSILIITSLTMFTMTGNWRSTAGITYIVIAVCEWFAYTEILAEIRGKPHGLNS